MNLRIQNDGVAGSSSAEVNRAGQSASTGAGSSTKSIASRGDGGDHIAISSAAESISAGVSANSLQHAARVTQLSALYANGSYSVDSGKVSRALVDNAVSGSAASRA